MGTDPIGDPWGCPLPETLMYAWVWEPWRSVGSSPDPHPRRGGLSLRARGRRPDSQCGRGRSIPDRRPRAISQDAPPSAPSSASPQGARTEDGGRGEAPRGRCFPSPRPPPPPRRLPGIPRSPEPSVTSPRGRPGQMRGKPRPGSGAPPPAARAVLGEEEEARGPGSRPAALAPVRGLEGLKANCGRREPGQSPGEAATPTPPEAPPPPRSAPRSRGGLGFPTCVMCCISTRTKPTRDPFYRWQSRGQNGVGGASSPRPPSWQPAVGA